MPPKQKPTRSRSSHTDGDDGTSSPEPSRSGRRTPAKSLNVPPFQSRDVKFWFFQLDALFRTSKVTDDQSKFDYVVQALDVTAASDIRDLLENPPDDDMYKTIKTTLLARLAVSEAKKIKRLLSNELLGDKTPSQHLRHLRSLAGDNFSEEALVSIWTDALPTNLRAIVAGNEELTLDKRAAMADRIMDVTGGGRDVAALSATPAGKDPQIAALVKQVSALTKSIKAIKTAAKPDKSNGPSKPKAPRAKSPHPGAKTIVDGGICWYHKKYQSKAQKCVPGCAWTGRQVASDSESEN